MSAQAPPRVVLVHPALAPYRVDQFNLLASLCDLTVVFLYDNVWNHPFDQAQLRERSRFKALYLLKGWQYKGRVLTRWGLLPTLRRLRPDIVISVEYSFATLLFVLLKRLGLLRARLASTIDDSLAICRKPQSRGRALARALTVRNLDGLIVLSREVADHYASAYGIAPDRIVVAPILQDAARLRSQDERIDALAAGHAERHGLRGRKVLLFVGRLIAEKGLLPFVQHVAPSLRRQSDLTFVIVGDGAERGALQRAIVDEGLEGRVLLAGRDEGPSLYAWYVCASGFVLPSVYEPFGAVVNEALIFGLPVMCSSLAGSAALAAQSGGLLFDPLDAAATRSAFDTFVQRLQPLAEYRTRSRPSLVQEHDAETRAEWGKLLGA